MSKNIKTGIAGQIFKYIFIKSLIIVKDMIICITINYANNPSKSRVYAFLAYW